MTPLSRAARWPPRARRQPSPSRRVPVESWLRPGLWHKRWTLFGIRILLLPPPREFFVLEDNHLERRINDVVRRAVDEGRILLDCEKHIVLKLELPLHDFRYLRNDGHSCSFVLRLWALFGTRAKHVVNGPFAVYVGWSDPTALWPGNLRQEWGRSSPLRCFARVQTNRRAMRNLYAPNTFASPSR